MWVGEWVGVCGLEGGRVGVRGSVAVVSPFKISIGRGSCIVNIDMTVLLSRLIGRQETNSLTAQMT